MATQSHWNADDALASTRTIHRLRMQRKRWYRSRLDAFTEELTTLRQRGASLGELLIFLKAHHLTVARSTILRWLKKHNVSPAVTE